jgi:hypothetical protein
MLKALLKKTNNKLKELNDKNPKAVIKHIFADVESVHRCIVEDEDKKRYILEIGGDKIPLIGETWKICYTHIREDKPTMCTLLEKVNE